MKQAKKNETEPHMTQANEDRRHKKTAQWAAASGDFPTSFREVLRTLASGGELVNPPRKTRAST
jgi:hypothetical protein